MSAATCERCGAEPNGVDGSADGADRFQLERPYGLGTVPSDLFRVSPPVFVKPSTEGDSTVTTDRDGVLA